MKLKILGRTGLKVTENSFGALPIQRRNPNDAKNILRYAYDRGINFFDTARMYSDSEYKIGEALSQVRQKIVIATKSLGTTRQEVLRDLETSLLNLKTDYIDIYQLHNPAALPDPADPDSSYAALLEAKKKGMIRYIGITNHRLHLAENAVASGLYDTLQFPISYISSAKELEIIEKTKEKNVGLIAMKALSGGLLTNARACFAFFSQYDNAVPIWGIQHKHQIDDFLNAAEEGVQMNQKYMEVIRKDRMDLAGAFCRGCGYCEPCPVGIKISQCGRMDMLLSRAVWQSFVTDEWKVEMNKIEDCIGCNSCKSRCPYELDCPSLLRRQLENYRSFCAAKREEYACKN